MGCGHRNEKRNRNNDLLFLGFWNDLPSFGIFSKIELWNLVQIFKTQTKYFKSRIFKINPNKVLKFKSKFKLFQESETNPRAQN
jgi:hypothetical protein